jgi:tetraacyldisaccharide 4'-kinase
LLLRGASAVYGAAAAWRRRWYAREPSRRKRLLNPVISVGNLSTGGRGKTPVVAFVARLLQQAGERPAILSRGYARRHRPEGVTIVADPSRIRADVETAGDEPLMLARALPGVPVLVAADRHSAGTVAESNFGVTVHVLDDGFQHLRLARDVDLLLVDEPDLNDRVLPAGHLREPLGAMRQIDALLLPAGADRLRERVTELAPDAALFGVRRALGGPIWFQGAPGPDWSTSTRVFAVAAIATPERFFTSLASAGWRVAGSRSFPDHYWFTADDSSGIERSARAAGAAAILTTDKDAVRLERLPIGLPVARVPLHVSIEPADIFRDWLLTTVGTARRRRPELPLDEPHGDGG